jgi:streptogramin lyase
MARVALVCVTVVLAVGGGGASGAGQKGAGPVVIATGYGSVWVGTGAGFVVRIDPRTRRVAQRIDVSRTSVAGLVPAYGGVWVATGTGLLSRIDPRTRRVTDLWRPDVCTSTSVAVAAGAIWVLDFHHERICRIDPLRRRISRRVWIEAGRPLTLWSDGTRLWLDVEVDPKPPPVEDHLEHVRQIALDPHTGAPLGPAIDTSGWVGFSGGLGSLWAADPVARTLARIDPSNGITVALRTGVDASWAPTAGFGALWLPAGRALLRLDPASLADVAAVPVAASSVAVGSGAVWVLSMADGTVTEVDPRTNDVVGRPIAIVTKP